MRIYLADDDGSIRFLKIRCATLHKIMLNRYKYKY